ncbi:MAG: YrdB family protein [Anaerolineae bacterium]|nr:YrdB family protein [Anaerolineae bacterium]
MAALKGINLGLSFLLELIMLFAYGYWGFTAGSSNLVHWVLGVGVPLVAIVIWSIYNAPMSKRRLPRTPRTMLEVLMFSLGALMLALAGQTQWAIVFVVLIVINQIGLYIWQQ